MNRIRHYILLVLLTLVVAGAQAQDKKLYVMHSGDTHSRIDPLDDNPAVRNAGMGGAARRVAVVHRFKTEHPDALVFDCGDISQGTPYYNMYKGELEVRIMNLAGYDAMTIGNHEFDFGLDNMARIFSLADFPVVCSNYDFTGTVLEGIVKPYVTLRRNGVKIGIFGLSPQLEGLVQQSKCEGVVYKDPVQTAAEMTALLKDKEKCDVIILLSHLGITRNPGVGSMYDNVLVPQTRHIDLVLGGHTHTFLEQAEMVRDADGREVPIMHIGNNGVFMSRSELTLEKVRQ